MAQHFDDVEYIRDRSPRHVGKYYDDVAAFTDPKFSVAGVCLLQKLLGCVPPSEGGALDGKEGGSGVRGVRRHSLRDARVRQGINI